jgi:hypothetical protein
VADQGSSDVERPESLKDPPQHATRLASILVPPFDDVRAPRSSMPAVRRGGERSGGCPVCCVAHADRRSLPVCDLGSHSIAGPGSAGTTRYNEMRAANRWINKMEADPHHAEFVEKGHRHRPLLLFLP